MTKIKPLLPSLREKKRYLVYEVISETKILDQKSIIDAILSCALQFLGDIGMAKAGMMFLCEKYNAKNQRGLIKVNNKMLNSVIGALCFVKSVQGNPVIIKSVGVSGILKKATDKYIAS